MSETTALAAARQRADVGFHARRTFAVITARDAAGRRWTSSLSGPLPSRQVALSRNPRNPTFTD